MSRPALTSARRKQRAFDPVRAMQLTVKTPPDFNFHRTVLSHGWCELLPFELDRAKWKLTRVLEIDRAKPVTATVSPRRGGMKIEVSRRVGRRAAQKIIRDARHMFRLDDDLQEFYRVMMGDSEFAWIAEQGASRRLR